MMKDKIRELLLKSIPLPADIAEARANCFNAVQLFWSDANSPTFLGPEEFVGYISSYFLQIPLHTRFQDAGDVSIVWSRSSNFLPIGHINIGDLQKEREGYPFGLIIEHAFVRIDENFVFQKSDPTPMGRYEVIPEEAALKPYLKSQGFEITRHRRM